MNSNEKIKHWEENEGIEILKSVGLKPGDSLIDFGCGFGHYTFPASAIVQTEGKIYRGIKQGKKWSYFQSRVLVE